jgi:hypothetical protein
MCVKNTPVSNSMKIRPVGDEFFHAGGRAGGRTDRHDEGNSRFSQSANSPKTLRSFEKAWPPHPSPNNIRNPRNASRSYVLSQISYFLLFYIFLPKFCYFLAGIPNSPAINIPTRKHKLNKSQL